MLLYQGSGFVFAIGNNYVDGKLPTGFIDANLKKGKWTFSSMELVSLVVHAIFCSIDRDLQQKKRNSRMKDALDETFLLSDAFVRHSVWVMTTTLKFRSGQYMASSLRSFMTLGLCTKPPKL